MSHNYNQNHRVSNFVNRLLSASTTLTLAVIYTVTAPGNFAFAINTSVNELKKSPQSLAQSITEIAIIDAAVKESATLVADLPDNIPVYYLNSEQDGIKQITEILKRHQNLKAVHILGHSQAGEMNLGSGVLNNQTLTRATAEIRSWSQALTAEADILLYGCNFAQGELGSATLAKFAQLTQADIAASNNDTGSSELGGDWNLEISKGKIESHIAIDRFARSNYALVLQSVANPDLPSNFCNQQINLIFVLDESGSVDSNERADQRQSVRDTLNYLVNNNINARAAIIGFATGSRILTSGGYVNVTSSTINGGALDTAINNYGVDGNGNNISGGTNWEAGFDGALSVANITNPGTYPDALFFFTDGIINTSTTNDGEGDTQAASADNEANTFKSNGTHIYSIGIGNGVSVNNLARLTDGSDRTVYTPNPPNPVPADHVDVANYSSLSSDFLSVFQDACIKKPSLNKAFTPAQIFPTQVSTLTFTITNIPGNPARNQIRFTDQLPDRLEIASAVTVNTCGGTLTNSDGDPIEVGNTDIRLTNGSLGMGETDCQITVEVTSKRDVNAATPYLNDSDNIPSGDRNNICTEDCNNTNASNDLSATLTVNPFPISTLAGGLIINEVLYAQTNSSTANNDEFIELYNTSGNPVNLAGLKLSDGNILATDNPNGTDEAFFGGNDAYVFGSGSVTESGNTTLQPGEYAVVWIGGQNPNSNAPGATFQSWLNEDPKLNNTGDDIWLYDSDANNSLIDYVAYGRNTSSSTAINVRPEDDDTGLWSQWDNRDEDRLDQRGSTSIRGQSISLTPNGIDGNTSACWEKTALPAGDDDSASFRCNNFLTTIDLDQVDGRITSVGANNNMNSDYGDVPSNLDTNSPAQHRISSDLYLGSVAPDAESNPQSSNDAGGDDIVADGNIDDEEGVSSFPLLRTDANNYSLEATVHNPNGLAANVYGWIDFDRDREFDQDERATATSNSSGTVTLTWNIKSNSNPAGANILNGDTYVRIRVSTDNLDQTGQTTLRDDASIGLATNGEVEDYPLNIQLAPINAQSYCASIGGTLNATNLFAEADNGTFGIGSGENQASDLPVNLTTYTYDPDFPPEDGEYIVSTRRTQVGFGSWHTMTGHTTGDVNDRFMIINANQEQENTEMIQSTFISGLTPNSNYTFTAYVLNTVEIPVVADGREHIDPNVSFGIDLKGIDDDEDGTVDEDKEVEIRFSSGDIPESPQPTWIRYSFLFNTGSATEARFVLRNNKIGGFGNDLAIDDISLHGCDLPVGNLEGKLYYDNNGNDIFDSGEPGLNPGSTVRLINTQGNNDPNDDVIVTRFANSGGDYSFLNIPQGSNYQITAPAQDTAGNPIGTTNPLTGITINTNQTTTNQNFGYDLNSKLLLVKRITAINPGKPDQVIFNGFENDPQDDSDDVANWSNRNIYLRGKISAENVKPGDEVEYTIYFLSDGINAVNNLSLCDVIPDNMTFVENSYGGTQGIGLALDSNALPTEPNSLLTNANDSDLAEFYLPNSTPPTFCKKVDSSTNTFVPVTGTNNTNGAVILDLENTSLPAATSPGTPPDSYGFLRFRARVK